MWKGQVFKIYDKHYELRGYNMKLNKERSKLEIKRNALESTCHQQLEQFAICSGKFIDSQWSQEQLL